MELIDSRCDACKLKTYQCTDCQGADKRRKQEIKKAAKALAPFAAPAPAPAKPSAPEISGTFSERQRVTELIDSRCDACKLKTYQCTDCQGADRRRKQEIKKAAKALAPAAAPAPAPAKPSAPEISGNFSERCAAVGHMILDAILEHTTSAKALAVAAAPAPATAAPEIPVANVSLRNVLKAAPFRFLMSRIPRNGHCLFESFVLAFKLLKLPNMPRTQQELRSACAKQLLEWNGNIPNMPPLFDTDGTTMMKAIRDGPSEKVSLKRYCSLLKTNLYGGFEEIMLIVQMFRLQVHLYEDSSYRRGSPVSIPILRNSELAEDHPDNAGPRIFLLLEMGKKDAVGDHTTLMIHRYAQYDDYMSRMPVQHRDYKIVQGIHGRGMQTMRRYRKDDLIGKLISIIIMF
jgi:hypothetical protein